MAVHAVSGRPSIHSIEMPMLGMPRTCSTYVIDGPEPTIVDTGPADAVEGIFDGLATLDIAHDDISYIVPTHAHLDHAGGAGHLAAACENATVVCHPTAVEYLTDEAKLTHLTESVERAIGMAQPYGEPRVIDRERVCVLGGSDTLTIGDRTLDVIDAPGHAPHQFCLFDRETSALFSADAVGMNFPDTGHRPATPPSDFDLEAALETIDRLDALDPELLLYAHIGPGEQGAARDELRRYRTMLSEYVDSVAELRADHGADVEAIAAEMDDEWGHWSLRTDVAGILQYLD